MSSASSPAALTLSSPPSSPNPYRFSSSPAPSSPEPTTTLLPALELDEPPLDPFSGTSKSVRPPPLYEKVTRIRPRSPGDASPPGPRKRARHAFDGSVEGRVSTLTCLQISPIATPITTNRYSEEENIWNEVISGVIDTVNSVVDLSCVLQAPLSQIGCLDLISVQFAVVRISRTYLLRSLLLRILSCSSRRSTLAPLSGTMRFRGQHHYLLLVHRLLALRRDQLLLALLPFELDGRRTDTGLLSICSSRRTKSRYFLWSCLSSQICACYPYVSPVLFLLMHLCLAPRVVHND
jgi:hypothetical protein